MTFVKRPAHLLADLADEVYAGKNQPEDITMRYAKVLLVATLLSTSAFAMHCPSKMAEIDAMLESNPPADSAQRLEVIALRAEGERLRKAGDRRVLRDSGSGAGAVKHS